MESEPAKGSTFFVSLPLRAPDRQTTLHRHEPVFLVRPLFFFKAQNFQRLDEPLARLVRPDRRVGELFRKRFEGAVEAFLELGDFFRAGFSRIGGLLDFAPVKHVDRAAAAHHRQFDPGPDEQLIGAHLARAQALAWRRRSLCAARS